MITIMKNDNFIRFSHSLKSTDVHYARADKCNCVLILDKKDCGYRIRKMDALQRQAWLSMTGAIWTTPKAAMEVLLGLHHHQSWGGGPCWPLQITFVWTDYRTDRMKQGKARNNYDRICICWHGNVWPLLGINLNI